LGFITVADIDNRSYNDVAIDTVQVSASEFSCGDIGDNTVTLTVTDTSDNVAECKSTVFLEDVIKPTAQCLDIIVQLGVDGTASITVADIDNASYDNCLDPNMFLVETWEPT
jgi:hypothetical protein